MLAMRDEEMFLFLAVLACGAVIAALGMRHSYRTQRLKTIEKALAAGQIDEATRRSLLDALAADAQQQREFWRALWANGTRIVRTIVFVGGWLTLTIGSVVLAGMWFFGGSRYDIQGGIIAVAIGFGLVTLPLAMRELDQRRAARG